MPLCLQCTFASFCFKMLFQTAVFRGVSTDSLSAASTFHFGAQDWREAMISKDWETGGNLIPHSTGKYSRMVVTWQFVRPAEVRLLGRLQKYSCPECVFFFSVRIREISACISNLFEAMHIRYQYHYINIPSHLARIQNRCFQPILLQHSKPFNRSPRVTLQFRISSTTNVPTL